MMCLASFLTGAVIGVISAAIFAVIVKEIAAENPKQAIKALRRLAYFVLGGGLADYAIFDYVLKSDGTLQYYMIGLASAFLLLALLIIIDWKR